MINSPNFEFEIVGTADRRWAIIAVHQFTGEIILLPGDYENAEDAAAAIPTASIAWLLARKI